MKRILASCACALLLLACQDEIPTEPGVPEPTFDINDVHSGGAALNQHFAFRFPIRTLTQRPPAGEAFNGSLQPILKVCRWSGSACDSPESELTMGSGGLMSFELPGQDQLSVRRNGIVVLPDLAAYLSLWDTRTLRPTGKEIAENEIYRLRVLVGPTELGFLDAKVWRTLGQLRQISEWNEANPDRPYFPLLRNSILPVPFWIGELALTQPRATSLDLTGLPASLISGASASLTVTAQNEDGSVATGYVGTVAFTSSDPDATLPPDYTFTAADAGTHTFTDAVSFKRAGSATTVRVTDAADGSIVGEAVLDVLPSAAVSLELSGLGELAAAGAASSITVTARDLNGNVATGYTGTVAFTSSDPQATLPAEHTFTPADAGTHVFEGAITLRTAGSVTIRAADNADPDVSGEVSVTVAAVAAATLQVTGLNDPAGAGTAGSIRVTARDPSGNLAADYTGTIAFTSTDPQATLPETYTFTAEDAGTHEFSAALTLRTAGSVTLTVTDQAVSTITGSRTVTVTPASATALVLAGIPEQTTAGVAYEPTVTARDQFGNAATGYVGTVQFSSSDPSAILPAPHQFQASDAGVRAFPGVTFKTAGGRTLQVTDVAAPGITVSLGTVVAPAAAAELRFTVQPTGALAGNAIAPPVVVTAYDPFGNLAAGFTGQVTIAIGTNPASGVLGGTLQVAAISGGATFADLTISAAGTGYTLAASATGVTSAVSEPFSITAPVPVEVHWVNAAGGNWSAGSNWSTGAVPTADQTALIDLAGTYTVTLDVNAMVNRLTLGAASGIQSLNTANSRTLAIMTSGNVLSTGRLTLNNSTVNGPGTLAIGAGGILNLSGTNVINAALLNAGTVITFNASTVNGGLSTEAGSLLQVRSVGFGGANLTVASGFTNNGTIQLTGTATNGTALTVNGTLTNAVGATIAILPGVGGERTLRTQLDNRGTLSLTAGLTISRNGADHTNSGTVSVTGGNLVVSEGGTTSSFTNTGTITVATGRLWSISGGSFAQGPGATLNGGGSLGLTSVSATFETAFALSALSLDGTTASFAADLSTETLGLSVDNSTISGLITLTNAAGKTLTLSGATVINTALVNAGTVVVLNSTRLNGSVATMPGSLLQVRSVGFGGALLTTASGFTNRGTIELTATVANGCGLTVNGTLINAEGALISVGGTPGGRTLTAQLDNQGTFSVGLPLTIARGSADHMNSGTINVTGGDLTVTQSGTTPSLTNSGTLNVVSPRTTRISSGVVTNGAGGSVQGTGAFETATAASFSNAGQVTVGLMRIGDGLTSTGTFTPVTAEFFGNPATIPVGPGYGYTNVRTVISATFAGSVNLAGDLTVAGPGNLTIGAHEITVGGNFATQNTGVLTMQNATGVLTIGGNASFGGGSTNGRLTAGTLRVGGNFAQAGGAAAFAPTLNHLTVLNGSGPQSVSFANPGAATTLSHFHRLEVQNSTTAGVTLAGPVFANGQLRTPAGSSAARVLTSAGQTLQVGGLNAVGLVLDNTPLRVVNGEPLDAFDDAVFRNMRADATQFRLDRLGDVVTFNNLQFLTPPETGVYLHLVDTDAVAPLFTVTLQGTQPSNHGGKVIESVAGQLVGWPL